MKYIVALFTITLSTLSSAQTSAEKEAIKKLCGCFEVEFKYAETFSPDPNYKYHDREEISGGTELSLPIEISDKKIVIQHLLVITDSIIVKHWREEWTYENPVIWKYQGNKTWIKHNLSPAEVKGKWTQTIWEVSDEPRYQGYSQFANLDGKIIWQSTTDAPLPRREYTVRNDYNILKRTNRINITDTGYIHEQDNEKILRDNGINRLITQEKGLNTYKRLPDNECKAALFYWENNKKYWGMVRSTWAAYINSNETISLKTNVEGKVLHEYLIDLSKQYAKKQVPEAEIESRIKQEISRFINR